MPMSDQLYEEISRALLGRIDPNLRVYHAAVAILRYHLGQDFITARIAHTERPDPFMLNDHRNVTMRPVHFTRVSELADFLYIVDGTPGFAHLLERLRTREMEPVFADAEAAANFCRSGFAVTVKREVGRRGQDFDFSATKDGRLINIEVTTTSVPTFRPNSIRNLLRKKRTQVPRESAAGLYVVIPASWQEGRSNLQTLLVAATRAAFRTSKRFNFVSYVWHLVQEQGAVIITGTVNWPVINDDPRCSAPDLSVLTAETPQAPMIRVALENGTELQAAPEENFDFMKDWNGRHDG